MSRMAKVLQILQTAENYFCFYMPTLFKKSGYRLSFSNNEQTLLCDSFAYRILVLRNMAFRSCSFTLQNK